MSTIHNPSNFNPADYEVEDHLDNQPPVYFGQGIEAFEQERAWWQAEMKRTFGADWVKKVHHCCHCGNGSVRWITAVRHLPTNEVVVFGAIRTGRLGFKDQHQFKLAQLQSRAEANKIRLGIWLKREAFLKANPALAEAIATIDAPVHAKNSFAKDVISKLNTYGDLSDKQVTAVIASLKRDVEFAAKKAAEVTEVKGDAPTGRQTVTGEVVSTKWQESQYGSTKKMLVKLGNNSKVWLTVPSKAYGEVNRGTLATVTATFEVSKDDKSFAFGSRPSLVKVEQPAAVAV